MLGGDANRTAWPQTMAKACQCWASAKCSPIAHMRNNRHLGDPPRADAVMYGFTIGYDRAKALPGHHTCPPNLFRLTTGCLNTLIVARRLAAVASEAALA